MKKITFFILLLMVQWAVAQKQKTITHFLQSSAGATPRGYSAAAVIDLGNCNMLIISGQVALDSGGNLIGKNDLGKQTEQVFKNIQSLLRRAGGNMEHLVKLNYFVLDISQIQKIRDIRDQFVHTKQPPASSLVEVSKLFREDVLIEVEGVAVIPKK